MGMNKLHNRAIILPFSIKYEDSEMTQCNKNKVSDLKKSNTPKNIMLENSNFIKFNLSSLETDFAELHLSFNDLIIVQGIIRKLT